MMVSRDSAQLYFHKETMLSCSADHSQIAKLSRGESGTYPDIKRAVKQALLRVVEDQPDVELSRLQLPLRVKASVEERSRHNGDNIKGSRPERTGFPAEESRLEDPQSLGGSIPEPQGMIADALHDIEMASARKRPASDGRKNGVVFQNNQAISDHTMTPPGTEAMSRDGEELSECDSMALEPSMQRATSASSDRKNAPSPLVKKEGLYKAMGKATRRTMRKELCSASKEGNAEKVRSLLAQGCSIHESSENLVDHERDGFLLAAYHGRLDVLKVLFEYGCDVTKRNMKGSTALHLISVDPEIKPKPVIESLVVLLLEQGVSLEARNANEDTALILSAYNGKIFIVECLLDHGADIHSISNGGLTALYMAAQNGHHEVVALLIAKGADIHSTDNAGYTALYMAASCGHHETVALLISKGADIYSTDNAGQTPLHWAAQKGHHKVVALLISKGVHINSTNNAGYTALDMAASYGHHETVALLISKGADINSTDNAGYTALHSAAYRDHYKVVALLIANGADINSTDNTGYTALHWAAQIGYHKVVALLIAKGADINSTDNIGCTALHMAAQNGHHEVVALLISKGVDFNSTDNTGCTALHRAAGEGTVALLISKGADIHSTDNAGQTPLHRAARNGHHKVVALLIAKGALLETRTTEKSFTPLHTSCLAGNDSGRSARLLLQAGAAKEAICFYSGRALHLAAYNGNLEVVNELLAFGVEIDAAASDDWRALHYAKHFGHWRIVEALLTKGANPLLLNKWRDRPSEVSWHTEANISPGDNRKCVNLLKDAEKAWREKHIRQLVMMYKTQGAFLRSRQQGTQHGVTDMKASE